MRMGDTYFQALLTGSVITVAVGTIIVVGATVGVAEAALCSLAPIVFSVLAVLWDRRHGYYVR